MIVLDASVWASVVLENDANHQSSFAWARQQMKGGQSFAVPNIFLIEIGSAVARRLGNIDYARRTVAKVRRDTAFRIMPLDDQLASLAVYRAIQLRLRAADAIYVALAEQLGVPLVTLDAEQARRSASLVTVITPYEA